MNSQAKSLIATQGLLNISRKCSLNIASKKVKAKKKRWPRCLKKNLDAQKKKSIRI